MSSVHFTSCLLSRVPGLMPLRTEPGYITIWFDFTWTFELQRGFVNGLNTCTQKNNYQTAKLTAFIASPKSYQIESKVFAKRTVDNAPRRLKSNPDTLDSLYIYIYISDIIRYLSTEWKNGQFSMQRLKRKPFSLLPLRGDKELKSFDLHPGDYTAVF
jgi:hypothetical protein